jgi:type II secretion system protein N
MIKIKKSRLLLGLYIAVILAFFLYRGFPSEGIKNYVAYQLSQISPQIEVTIDRIAPALPPGLQLYNVDLYHQEQVWGSFENVKIRPHLFSLFGSQKAFTFTADAYAGQIKGNAEIETNSPIAQMAVDATLFGIQVQDVEALQVLSDYDISGILEGIFAFKSEARNQNLTGTLSLSDVRVELIIPLFDQGVLTFNDVTADVVLKNNNLTIQNCRLEGKQLDASVTGSILLNRDFSRGVLNLDAIVTPHHMLLAVVNESLPFAFLKGAKGKDNGFKFKIRGSTDAPQFSLN